MSSIICWLPILWQGADTKYCINIWSKYALKKQPGILIDMYFTQVFQIPCQKVFWAQTPPHKGYTILKLYCNWFSPQVLLPGNALITCFLGRLWNGWLMWVTCKYLWKSLLGHALNHMVSWSCSSDGSTKRDLSWCQWPGRKYARKQTTGTTEKDRKSSRSFGNFLKGKTTKFRLKIRYLCKRICIGIGGYRDGWLTPMVSWVG